MPSQASFWRRVLLKYNVKSINDEPSWDTQPCTRKLGATTNLSALQANITAPAASTGNRKAFKCCPRRCLKTFLSFQLSFAPHHTPRKRATKRKIDVSSSTCSIQHVHFPAPYLYNCNLLPSPNTAPPAQTHLNAAQRNAGTHDLESRRPPV